MLVLVLGKNSHGFTWFPTKHHCVAQCGLPGLQEMVSIIPQYIFNLQPTPTPRPPFGSNIFIGIHVQLHKTCICISRFRFDFLTVLTIGGKQNQILVQSIPISVETNVQPPDSAVNPALWLLQAIRSRSQKRIQYIQCEESHQEHNIYSRQHITGLLSFLEHTKAFYKKKYKKRTIFFKKSFCLLRQNRQRYFSFLNCF